MRRFFGSLCCAVVAMQALAGLVAALAVAMSLHFSQEWVGPLALEFRVSTAETVNSQFALEQQTTSSLAALPPPNCPPPDDSILAARSERGSLLTGTLFGEHLSPEDEQQQFVAAFREVANNMGTADALSRADALSAAATPTPPLAPSLPLAADQLAVAQLYAMADRDEQAGIYARADQWRGLARSITAEIVGSGGSAIDDVACQRLAERQ